MNKYTYITPELEQFLRKERVLTKFIKNLKGRESPLAWMTQAFVWEDTPEGHSFWHDLHYKFYLLDPYSYDS